MRKTINNKLKTLLNRVENLAKKEHRDIVGQLSAILELYETRTGISSKRPYNRKPTPATSKKKAEPRLKTAKPEQLALLDGSGNAARKVRSDKGKKRGSYKLRQAVLQSNSKLVAARKKLACLTGNQV